MKVKLKDIIEEIQIQSKEYRSYLNLKTGEIVYVSQKALLIAEDGEEYDYFSQLDDWAIARDIVVRFKKYRALPTGPEIKEYAMRKSFSNSLFDDQKKEVLLKSILWKGAPRQFNYYINRFSLTEQWCEYLDRNYKQIAIEFCERNHIKYIE